MLASKGLTEIKIIAKNTKKTSVQREFNLIKILCFIPLAVLSPYPNFTSKIIKRQMKKPHSQGAFSLADPTGFKPAISSVTGRRVNQATPRVQIMTGVGIEPTTSGL